VSKLNAEYIHKLWQAEQPDKRKLIIVRPGVVFGYHEAGNFTRLYNSLKNGYFFYPGRKNTIKATIYVKDVCRILYDTSVYEKPGVLMLNLTYASAPTIETICKTIAHVTKVKQPQMIVTPKVLKFAAGIVYAFAKAFGKDISGIHPDRVKKLMISTNISGHKLLNSKYSLKYTLEEAISDWFNDCKQQGLY
jgi:nucleoside-diphosphate-sugar epimerase